MSMLQPGSGPAARLRKWMPTKSGPSPQTEPTARSLEVIALYGLAVVHWKAWCSALRVALSRAQTDRMKFSTEIAQILISHSRSPRLLVEALIFITRFTNFSWVQSNDGGVDVGRLLFQHTWRDGRSAYHGILHKFPRSRFSENHALRCRIEPSSIYDNSSWGQQCSRKNGMLVPAQTSTPGKTMKQQRDRHRKHIV